MTLEVDLHALRQETLPSDAAATSEDGPAFGRFRTCTEAKLLLARSLGGLVGP